MKIGTQQVASSALPMPFLRRDFSSVQFLKLHQLLAQRRAQGESAVSDLVAVLRLFRRHQTVNAHANHNKHVRRSRACRPRPACCNIDISATSSIIGATQRAAKRRTHRDFVRIGVALLHIVGGLLFGQLRPARLRPARARFFKALAAHPRGDVGVIRQSSAAKPRQRSGPFVCNSSYRSSICAKQIHAV